MDIDSAGSVESELFLKFGNGRVVALVKGCAAVGGGCGVHKSHVNSCPRIKDCGKETTVVLCEAWKTGLRRRLTCTHKLIGFLGYSPLFLR